MKIRLTEKEYTCLMEDGFLPKNLAAAIGDVIRAGVAWSVELSDEHADAIRDLCGERLQEVGFDENYNPNEKGRLLESLMDKLFIG